MENKKNLLVDLAFIALLGLIPLAWFMPGHFVISVDFNLPFTLERWVNEVFYSWIANLGAGQCPRMIESTHFFFFVQWLPQFLGMSLLAAQRFVFTFWFALPGFTFYFLMRHLLRDFSPAAARAGSLAAVAFYMFNLFLEPVWLGVSVSNLLAYAFLPLFLLLWMRALDEMWNPFLTGFVFGVLSLAASGIATNPANVFVFLVPFVLFTLGRVFRSLRAPRALGHLALLLVFTALFCLLFNYYWIAAELKKVFVSTVATGQAAGRGFIVDSWLEGVSRFASFWNVIRMQGCWTWYAEPRPYAIEILNNPFFVALSWGVPALGLAGLLCRSRHRLFFACVLGLGIVFSMGVHAPLGKIYSWMVRELPFFWLVRSPWFKFMMLTAIGYAYFFGVLAARVSERARKPLPRRGILAGMILFPMVYSYPVTLGKIFMRPGEGGATNHFRVPEYVEEAAAYVNAQPGNGRVWSLPGKGFFISRWGFSGFTPFAPYLVRRGVLYTDHNLTVPVSEDWLSSVSHAAYILQNAFEKRLSPNLRRWLGLFGADRILAEKDFRWEFLGIPFSLEQMHAYLTSLPGVELEKSFGEWDLYRVQGKQPHFYLAENVTLVAEGLDALVPLCNTGYFEKGALFFAAETPPSVAASLLQRKPAPRIVLFERELFDLAVETAPAAAHVRVHVDKKDKAPPQIQGGEFSLAEEGNYAVFARKKRRVTLSLPRSLVDRLGWPQWEAVDWSPRREGSQLWVELDGAPLAASIESEILENPFGPGEMWQTLGIAKLPAGAHRLELAGKLPELFGAAPEIWVYELRWVKTDDLPAVFKRLAGALAGPSTPFCLISSTQPDWNDAERAVGDPEALTPHPDLKVNFSQEFAGTVSFGGTDDWRPHLEEKEIFSVENGAGEPRAAWLGFSVHTHQSVSRNLSVYVNGKEVRSLETPRGETRGVLFPIEFQPGKNTVSIRSNAHPETIGGVRGSLFLRGVSAGDLKFEKTFRVPFDKTARLKIFPFRQLDSEAKRFALWDGKKIGLRREVDEGGTACWVSEPLRISAGTHRFEFLQKEGKSYFVYVETDGAAAATSGSVSFERINPTLYRGKARAEKEEWLVFSESFDPRWKLTVGDKEISPVRVNGYANAYRLPSTGGRELPVRLDFIPQRHLEKGIRFSAWALGISTVAAAAVLFFTRRRRRKQPLQ